MWIEDADGCDDNFANNMGQTLRTNFSWPPPAGAFDITVAIPHVLAGCVYVVCLFLTVVIFSIFVSCLLLIASGSIYHENTELRPARIFGCIDLGAERPSNV